MIQRALHYYEFGPFRLNVTERLLQRGNELVPLTPKVFDTLLVLVENTGHIVEKSELMQQLWPDSFVEESSLTQNISLLRRALSDMEGKDSYIETIPKRGYRFVGDVQERDELTSGNVNGEVSLDVAETADHISYDRKTNHYVVAFSACLLIGALVTFIYWVRHRSKAENFTPRSIAVLPFKTIGADNQDDLLGLGMADAMIIKLSRLDQLTVLPTSSVFRFQDRDKDAVQILRELGVEGILDGTVQRDGDWIRVSAQLIRLRDGKTVWSGKFDERYSSIFNLQDSVSEQVAVSLRPQIAQNETQRTAQHLTDDTEAYQAYLTGLYFWNRRTKANLPKAIEYLEHAVSRDPNFAEARAMLADCYYLTAEDEYGGGSIEEAIERASAAVSKALELDDNLAQAHTVKAGLKMYERKMDEAGREFRRALELNPNYAVGHLRYAYYLFFDLKLEDALVHMRRAQQLDPVSPITNGALAGMLFNAHDFDGCIEYSKRALDLEPTAFGARLNLGEAYAQKRMFTEAHQEFDKVRDVNPRYVYWEKAYAYGLAGRREDALRSIAEAEKHTDTPIRIHFNYAQVFAAMEEKDKAFAEMEKMQPGRMNLASVKFDPAFDPLRADARFKEYLKKHGID